MTSLTVNPGIENGALQIFQDSFADLAQQTKSLIGSSAAVVHLTSRGKTVNHARMGRTELTEVNTRNPDKQFDDYALDNRRLTKRRFTKTFTIDAKDDINELLADPTSSLLRQLDYAKERVIDRILAASAVGSVLTGPSDAAATAVSAANDGVLTVNATSGLTYEKVTEITENFINKDVSYAAMRGSLMCVAGGENSDLMAEDEFINSDFISGKPVEDGVATSAGMYRVALFAGSKNGSVQVINPILPEGSTTRKCLVLAPGSLAMAMELARLDVERSNRKVNSWDLTIDFWINSMRTEGALVQIVETTM